MFGKEEGIARHDATYGKAPIQLGHFGCTLFVAVIARLPLASARDQTQPYSATEGYRSLLQQLSDDPVILSKMGTGTLHGDQFPDWSQDYGLPSVVRAGITAGLSGFGVWGPDIAENGHSLELWTRWVEFGALTPIMRDHPWDRPAGAINIWHDAETIDIFRQYARLHISLYPYFDAYARQSASTGLPIMRHLLLNYPDDPNTCDVADEYLLGDSIVVAPVIAQGATTRSVYLPQGAWTEYWTGKTFDGGKNVTVAAPLRQIPFFVRAGTLLPLIRPETETLASDLAAGKYSTLTGDLTWRLFPSSVPSHSIIILGDGTLAEAIEDRAQIEIKVQYAVQSRRNEVIVPTNVPPRQVLLAGQSLSQTNSSDVRVGTWMPRPTPCTFSFKAATSTLGFSPDGDLR